MMVVWVRVLAVKEVGSVWFLNIYIIYIYLIYSKCIYLIYVKCVYYIYIKYDFSINKILKRDMRGFVNRSSIL